MGLRTEPVLSRLGLRLRARRDADERGAALTDEDHDNLDHFQRVLTRTLDLLASENAALLAGDTTAVAGLYEQKAQLLKTLELHQPRVEPFLRDAGDHLAGLRDLIRRLGDQLQTNGRLLKGMADASRAILDEVERTRDRQGLRGLYDKSGHLRAQVGPDLKILRKEL
jgi:flagellar biosynthesis/type III secretory pathway chaperone